MTCIFGIKFRVLNFPIPGSFVFLLPVAWSAAQSRCLALLRIQFCRAQCSPWFCRSVGVSEINFRWWPLKTFSIALWTLRIWFRSCVRSFGFFISRRQIRGWGWPRSCVILDGCRWHCRALSSISEVLSRIGRANLSVTILDVRLELG